MSDLAKLSSPSFTSYVDAHVASATPTTTAAATMPRPYPLTEKRPIQIDSASVTKSNRNGFTLRNSNTSCIVVSPPTGVAARRAAIGQRGRGEQLETLGGAIAVDLLHVELAHEGDRLRRDDLRRDHARKARRVGDHEVCRHELGSVLEPVVDRRARELHELAIGLVVGHEERRAHVARVARAPG